MSVQLTRWTFKVGLRAALASAPDRRITAPSPWADQRASKISDNVSPQLRCQTTTTSLPLGLTATSTWESTMRTPPKGAVGTNPRTTKSPSRWPSISNPEADGEACQRTPVRSNAKGCRATAGTAASRAASVTTIRRIVPPQAFKLITSRTLNA